MWRKLFKKPLFSTIFVYKNKSGECIQTSRTWQCFARSFRGKGRLPFTSKQTHPCVLLHTFDSSIHSSILTSSIFRRETGLLCRSCDEWPFCVYSDLEKTWTVVVIDSKTNQFGTTKSHTPFKMESSFESVPKYGKRVKEM